MRVVAFVVLLARAAAELESELLCGVGEDD
jgi:hypothetical protein